MTAVAEKKPYTITFANAHTYRIEHNNRMPGFKDQPHIDPNGEYHILIAKPIDQMYEELFGESVREHNAKQTDSRRIITDYLQKIKNEEQGARSGKKNAKHTAYEVIIQIGDKDHRPSDDDCKKIMVDYLKKWKERNPNFKIFNLVYHGDEKTPHFHLTYIPISRDNKRGLSVQNSLSGALREMGFVKDGSRKNNPEKQWTDRERAFFEEICKKHGLEIHHPQAGKGVKHLSVKAYKLTKDKEALEREIETKQKTVSQLQSTAARQHNRAENERLRADSEASRAAEQIELRKTAKRDTEALEAKKEALHNYIDQKAAEAKQAHLKAVEEITDIKKRATALNNARKEVSELAQKISYIDVFGTPEDKKNLETAKRIIDKLSERNGFTVIRTSDRFDDRETDRFDDDTDFLPG